MSVTYGRPPVTEPGAAMTYGRPPVPEPDMSLSYGCPHDVSCQDRRCHDCDH